MKKVYNEVELEIISLVAEDVITTSDYGYNQSILDGDKETWEW